MDKDLHVRYKTVNVIKSNRRKSRCICQWLFRYNTKGIVHAKIIDRWTSLKVNIFILKKKQCKENEKTTHSLWEYTCKKQKQQQKKHNPISNGQKNWTGN